MNQRDTPLTAPENTATAGTHFYRVFDLVVESEIPLEELPVTAPSKADVHIRLRKIDHAAMPTEAHDVVDFGRDQQLLVWQTVGAFLISGTDVIDVEPWNDAGPRLIALPLLGTVFAVLLHLRGLLVLHASALDVDGRGAVFMGDKGAGKSTTAGAFIAAGHSLVTDDIVAIRAEADGSFSILPAIAQLKLWEDAATALALTHTDRQVEIHPAIEKRQHWLKSGFASNAVPARCIMVLARSTETRIVDFPPGEAVTELLRFSYVARFGDALLKGARAIRHLQQCAAVVQAMPIARFEIASGLEHLKDAVKTLEIKLGAQRL